MPQLEAKVDKNGHLLLLINADFLILINHTIY